MAKCMYLILILALSISFISAYQQCITVKGQLLCGNKPVNSKTGWVKVLNKRWGFDDTKEAAVNDDGTYEVTLEADRSFWFDPELHVYTDCNDDIIGIPKGCQRKWKVKIPDKYVKKGSIQLCRESPYNAGTFQMEGKMEDEDRDCDLTRPGPDKSG